MRALHFALFLDQSEKKDIKGTIIYCAGFYPGKKEGMTTFFAMLHDQPYNFLFFDARGHGESEGCFLDPYQPITTSQNFAHYGKFEHLDIIAAIEYIGNYNKQKNSKIKLLYMAYAQVHSTLLKL